MSQLNISLKKRFKDKDYAHSYMNSHVVSRIGAQIHTIRKQRDLTQSELATQSGISQEKISLYENAEFSSLTLKTLYKLAKAFDVNLEVRFNEFSKGIEDVVAFSKKHLQVELRQDDLDKYSPEQSERTYIKLASPLAIPRPRRIQLKIQTSLEVVNEHLSGSASNFYISLVVPNKSVANRTLNELINSPVYVPNLITYTSPIPLETLI